MGQNVLKILYRWSVVHSCPLKSFRFPSGEILKKTNMVDILGISLICTLPVLLSRSRYLHPLCYWGLPMRYCLRQATHIRRPFVVCLRPRSAYINDYSSRLPNFIFFMSLISTISEKVFHINQGSKASLSATDLIWFTGVRYIQIW